MLIFIRKFMILELKIQYTRNRNIHNNIKLKMKLKSRNILIENFKNFSIYYCILKNILIY